MSQRRDDLDLSYQSYIKGYTIQSLSRTGHISHASWPKVAGGCHAGRCRARTFPSWQRVPLDIAAVLTTDPGPLSFLPLIPDIPVHQQIPHWFFLQDRPGTTAPHSVTTLSPSHTSFPDYSCDLIPGSLLPPWPPRVCYPYSSCINQIKPNHDCGPPKMP